MREPPSSPFALPSAPLTVRIVTTLGGAAGRACVRQGGAPRQGAVVKRREAPHDDSALPEPARVKSI